MKRSPLPLVAPIALGILLTLSCRHSVPEPPGDCRGIESEEDVLISFWYTPAGPRGIGSARSTVSLDGRVWNEGILQASSCSSLKPASLDLVEAYVLSRAFQDVFFQYASTPDCTDCCYAQLGVELSGQTVIRDLGPDTILIEPFIVVLDSVLQKETGPEYVSVGSQMANFFSRISALPPMENPCQNK